MRLSTLPLLMGFLLLLGQVLAKEANSGLAATFGQEYRHGKEPSGSVQKLWQQIEEDGEEYLKRLLQDKGFNGLYFRGEGWKSLDSSDHEYRYGIELELFDNGRYEGQQKQARKVVESRTRYLKLLDDMSRRAVDEQLHNLGAIRIRLKRQWLAEKLSLLNEQLSKAREELKAGFLVKEGFSDYLVRQTEAEVKFESLKDASDAAIPRDWLEWLNGAENLVPLSVQELVERAYRQDYELKLQRVFMERAKFQPDWRDDLEARFFIEKRHHEGLQQDNDVVVGFRTRLPLHRVANKDSLIRLEKQAYEEQAESIRLRLRQKIDQRFRLLRLHQADLHAKLEQLGEIDGRIVAERKHADLVIASLPYTPQRRLRVLARQKLDLLYEILLQRIQVLEDLINLAGLTRDRSPSSVLAGGTGSCSGCQDKKL